MRPQGYHIESGSLLRPEAPSSYLSALALFQLKNSIPYRVAKLCHIFSTSQDILSYIFLKTITALLYI